VVQLHTFTLHLHPLSVPPALTSDGLSAALQSLAQSLPLVGYFVFEAETSLRARQPAVSTHRLDGKGMAIHFYTARFGNAHGLQETARLQAKRRTFLAAAVQRNNG
jgi:hypothetical protein